MGVQQGVHLAGILKSGALHQGVVLPVHGHDVAGFFEIDSFRLGDWDKGERVSDTDRDPAGRIRLRRIVGVSVQPVDGLLVGAHGLHRPRGDLGERVGAVAGMADAIREGDDPGPNECIHQLLRVVVGVDDDVAFRGAPPCGVRIVGDVHGDVAPWRQVLAVRRVRGVEG